MALLMGNDANDPLFLQVKESVAPAHSPYTVKLSPPFDKHHGMRVVMGQRALRPSRRVAGVADDDIVRRFAKSPPVLELSEPPSRRRA